MQADATIAPSEPITVAALYRFTTVEDPATLQRELQDLCEAQGLLGTLLVAGEGINGTVAGAESGIRTLIDHLRGLDGFADLEWKTSVCSETPFYRMKVRVKKEIVTLGIPSVDPTRQVGEYVAPADWNALIEDPEVRLVDTRNHYEVHLGAFQGAEDPATESFRDFPHWVRENLDPQRDRKVAMFCTGGIRCEKATAYLLEQGFEAVYHLHGGILNYLAEVPQDQSLWQGECFVFDNRVTVDHDLQPGDHEICFNCRMPVTADDKASERYQKHVSCPHCFDQLTDERRNSLLERQRQIDLADQRGEAHIGRRFPDSEPST